MFIYRISWDFIEKSIVPDDLLKKMLKKTHRINTDYLNDNYMLDMIDNACLYVLDDKCNVYGWEFEKFYQF